MIFACGPLLMHDFEATLYKELPTTYISYVMTAVTVALCCPV